MKIVRMILQSIGLFLQTYFFIETYRLHTEGLVMFLEKPIESTWFSLLFTFFIVTACELLFFIEAVIYVIYKRNWCSFINLSLVIINAAIFMTLAYYSDIGTTICISFYVLLLVFRIICFTLNVIDISKNARKKHI